MHSAVSYAVSNRKKQGTQISLHSISGSLQQLLALKKQWKVRTSLKNECIKVG